MKTGNLEMTIDNINKSTSPFPFKQVKGNRGNIKFRQLRKNQDGTGTEVNIEHGGYDHVTINHRLRYKLDNGNIGNKRVVSWELDAKTAVQLASVLIYLADEHMRDSNEEPHIHIITGKEKSNFKKKMDSDQSNHGTNWVNMDISTATQRIENRKSRSHLFGLMSRFLETCKADSVYLPTLLLNLHSWAEETDDAFSMQQAEKASTQLGLGESD